MLNLIESILSHLFQMFPDLHSTAALLLFETFLRRRMLFQADNNNIDIDIYNGAHLYAECALTTNLLRV
jgi:hypothetical protein